MTTKALKKQLAAAIAMVLVAGVALSSSTYAWFVNNTKVTAEKVSVSAKAANTLLISEKGAGSWKTLLPMTDSLLEIVPVSTVGGTDVTELKFVKDTDWGTDTTDSKDYAITFDGATPGTEYWVKQFDIKSSLANKVLYLDTDTTFNMKALVLDDKGNDDATDDVLSGTDNTFLKTLRLGLVIDGKTFIYQVDEVVNTTSAYDTSIDSETAVNGITKAINDAGAAAAIVTSNADDTLKLHLATAPTSNDAFVSVTNDADELYTFTSADEIVTVTAYIWMEGCDYDTNSAMVSKITGQGVEAVLGFAVK